MWIGLTNYQYWQIYVIHILPVIRISAKFHIRALFLINQPGIGTFIGAVSRKYSFIRTLAAHSPCYLPFSLRDSSFVFGELFLSVCLLYSLSSHFIAPAVHSMCLLLTSTLDQHFICFAPSTAILWLDMHANNCGHAITRDDVSVTDLNSELHALEAWHIRSEPHSVNQEYGMLPSNWLHTPSRNGCAYAKSSFHLSWSIEQPNSVMFLCMYCTIGEVFIIPSTQICIHNRVLAQMTPLSSGWW